jgi:hypothetical protein
MGRSIFISYRRDDTEGEAGRLFDDLVRSFGEDSVFMDVSDIRPGVDFRKEIDDNVASCGVLLAIIGPSWSSIHDASGNRRLDNPNDFVRLEIGSALARDIAVIPVLVHDAKMPRPEELPENLKDLAFRNSVEITHARWNSDVQLLTNALTRYVSPTASSDTKPVHATVAVQLPPPTASKQEEPSARPSSVPLKLGIVAAAVLALGTVGFFLFPHPKPVPAPPNPTPNIVPVQPEPISSVSAFVGTWMDPHPRGGNSLAKLEVTTEASQTLSMHAWGHCDGCDWGTQQAAVNGQMAQATWQLEPGPDGKPTRTAVVAIHPEGGQLSVSVFNTYPGGPPKQFHVSFVKAQ